jgi:hypothetical protein
MSVRGQGREGPPHPGPAKSRNALEADRNRLRLLTERMCHVWTAPGWQGKSSRCSAGRSSDVFGLLARHTGPLAIMPSADQVPVNSTHSTMRWHRWVVLIAGSTGSALRAVRPPNLHITPDARRDRQASASLIGRLGSSTFLLTIHHIQR